MSDNWFGEVMNTLEPIWQATLSALAVAYDWAKAWQILLAGLLVLLAAMIVARAITKAAAAPRPSPKDRRTPDLRSEPKASNPQVNPQTAPQELAGNLEQLRSIIRSALASLTLTADKDNSPAYFLCQRITHLHLDRFPLPVDAGKTAREHHAALLQQLETLRQNLSAKKDTAPGEIAQILVQLNGSARNLLAVLAPATDAPLKADLR
jgi:hypothetical protein